MISNPKLRGDEHFGTKLMGVPMRSPCQASGVPDTQTFRAGGLQLGQQIKFESNSSRKIKDGFAIQ